MFHPVCKRGEFSAARPLGLLEHRQGGRWGQREYHEKTGVLEAHKWPQRPSEGRRRASQRKARNYKDVRPKQVADFAESVFGKEQGWPRRS
jgi:hypothetical protein